MTIVLNILKSAIREIFANKFRSFLTFSSISFGVFVIISILSVINSLQIKIKSELFALGNKVIFIQKWPSGGGDDNYPWWEYIGRPETNFKEMALLHDKMPEIKNIACFIYLNSIVKSASSQINDVKYYGITEKYTSIQHLPLIAGRYFLPEENKDASNNIIMGYGIAEKTFGTAEIALNKPVTLKNGRIAVVCGVMKKRGVGILDGWNYDECILINYKFAKNFVKEQDAGPVIMIQGSDNWKLNVLKGEIRGNMRAIRRLKPTQNDNFAINDIEGYTQKFSDFFSKLTLSAWFISSVALIIGIFNTTNIMYVLVNARVKEIGLKKALGAKKKVIIIEFMSEAILLCLFGGLAGLGMVALLINILPGIIQFELFLPVSLALEGLAISIVAGAIAGLLPSKKAAALNPITALRSI